MFTFLQLIIRSILVCITCSTWARPITLFCHVASFLLPPWWGLRLRKPQNVSYRIRLLLSVGTFFVSVFLRSNNTHTCWWKFVFIHLGITKRWLVKKYDCYVVPLPASIPWITLIVTGDFIRTQKGVIYLLYHWGNFSFFRASPLPLKTKWVSYQGP